MKPGLFGAIGSHGTPKRIAHWSGDRLVKVDRVSCVPQLIERRAADKSYRNLARC